MLIKKESNVEPSYLGLKKCPKILVTRWEIEGIYHQRKVYLEYLVEKLCHFLIDKNIKLYLVVGNDNFNENSRIFNYYKLWKSLKKWGLEVKNGLYSEEICLKKEDKVKFVGAIQILNNTSISDVVNVLLARLNSHLLLLPSESDVMDFLKCGCSRIISENIDYIKEVANQGGVVLFREGYFDDYHTGFLAFGSIPLINEALFGK